jgi:hypothetical protein
MSVPVYNRATYCLLVFTILGGLGSEGRPRSQLPPRKAQLVDFSAAPFSRPACGAAYRASLCIPNNRASKDAAGLRL